tara:strand:+ start:102 stop:1037 length:936 start_codon:yes stop_codon:yes gene_type:complete
MKFKKPQFWDYKKISFWAFLLLPFTVFTLLANNFRKSNIAKKQEIKTICVGNIYVGGTGKTPSCILINKLISSFGYKTAFIKKKYDDQIDEQKILDAEGTLFCNRKRLESFNNAKKTDSQVLIFDDGLQDYSIFYDLTFVCFNSISGIGNGQLLPAGPLREKLSTLKRFDAVFLNGNGEDNSKLINLINTYNPKINIFEQEYSVINLEKFDKKKEYMIFSGIGNPKSFLKTLKKNNFKISKIIEFPDHYQYSSDIIKKMKEEAKKLKYEIITTEKDYLRLNSSDKNEIHYLKIELKTKDKEKLKKFLQKEI